MYKTCSGAYGGPIVGMHHKSPLEVFQKQVTVPISGFLKWRYCHNVQRGVKLLLSIQKYTVFMSVHDWVRVRVRVESLDL